ncbi:hypothetical protein V8G54_036454 [Vigna mungo]|uniref:Uncharacterized protein n=1 Tax=Vigna mungo TaxID=3915 RepID=A0AAQ3RGL7_VIGMU
MCSIFSGSRFILKFGVNSKSKHNLRRFRVYAMAAAAAARVSNVGGGGGVVRFPLSASSALVIQKGDITKWSIDGSTDAIVHFVLFSPDIYDIWLNKVDELLKD